MKKILCLIAIATIVSSGCSVLKMLEPSLSSIQPESETTVAPSTATKKAAQELPPEADSSAAYQQTEFAWHSLVGILRGIYKPKERRSGKVSLEALKKKSAKAKLHSMLITNCELDHLKVFVASKIAPIVIISNDKQSAFVAVTAYKDEDEQITYTFLTDKKPIKMKYSKFEAHWKKTGTPQKALILSPRSVEVAQIKRALAVYLPKEKLANLTFN